MNNDRPPASKLRKWLMGNKESTLPGLTDLIFDGLATKKPNPNSNPYPNPNSRRFPLSSRRRNPGVTEA